MLLKGPITPMVEALTALALVVADRRVAWLGGLRWRWGLPLLLAGKRFRGEVTVAADGQTTTERRIEEIG